MNAFVSSIPLLRASTQRSKTISSRYYEVPHAKVTLDTSTKLVDIFPNGAKVLATDGRGEVDLVELVGTGVGVVAIGWLRHYGCTLCSKQAKEWLELDMRGGSKLLVGNGTPEQATLFASEVKWPPKDLYSDPERKTYNALEFAKGPASTFTLDALKVTINSFKDGNNQVLSRIPTDPFQQGGAIILDQNNNVRFIHRDSFAGDHASISDLQDVIDQVSKIPNA